MKKESILKSNSCLRWPGGKGFMAPIIQEYYRPYEQTHRFVEVFAGGLSLSFYLQPKVGVLANDINWALINFYQQLQLDSAVDLPMENKEELFYELRKEFNDLKKTILADNPDTVYGEKIAKNSSQKDLKKLSDLFYFLNRYAFNGLYRENKRGEFNAPFANYKYSKGENDLSKFQGVIKNWQFVSGDFTKLSIDDSDFLFLDPPYTNVEFTSYNKDGFTWDDQVRMVEWLKKSARNNPQIITNQYSDRIIELYKEYGYTIIDNKRNKNFKGKNSEESKKEILATKNLLT